MVDRRHQRVQRVVTVARAILSPASAETAVDTAASWVAENLATRVSLRESHVGDMFWDVG